MQSDTAAKSGMSRKAVKRFTLWTVAIFALNIVAQVAGIAAMFAVFNKNYLLAAFPAAFALLLVLLQPWLLLLQMLPGGSFIGIPASAVISVLVYGALNRAGKLEGMKRHLRKIGMRRALVTGAIACVSVVASGFLGYTDALPQNRGFPRQIGTLPAAQRLLMRDSRYYVLSDFLGSEVVMRTQVRPEDLNDVTRALHLAALSRDNVPADFARKPPLWWRPHTTGDVKVFSTGGFTLEHWGGEGSHTLAVYEPETQLLYLWIKHNFM